MGDVSVSTETARWLRYLPLRWTAGAFFIVVVWSGLSGLLQGAFSDPVGGQLASAIRLLVNIVIPLIFLGFLWGFSERRRLEQAISNGQAAIEQSLRRSLLLNIAKAFVCGVAFGLFTYVAVGRYRAFRPWDSYENIELNVLSVVAYSILALPIGAFVGFLLRRGLTRRFFPQAS